MANRNEKRETAVSVASLFVYNIFFILKLKNRIISVQSSVFGGNCEVSNHTNCNLIFLLHFFYFYVSIVQSVLNGKWNGQCATVVGYSPFEIGVGGYTHSMYAFPRNI